MDRAPVMFRWRRTAALDGLDRGQEQGQQH